MTGQGLQAPFPYFGGKSKIADKVWVALGQPKHYIEPFFGSGAVLLLRPEYDQTKHVETVNDKDGFVCNVWRSIQFSPDETAKWCDWPVNHADLTARKIKLIENENYLIEGLTSDPEWHDPKLAGYWIWAASCWIGSGLTRLRQRPHISQAGQGVHRLGQIPHISRAGQGVHRLSQIPNIGDCGKGVHRLSQRPQQQRYIESPQAPYNPNIYTRFRQLSERLRHVRVVCGDWKRVCGGNWQDNMGVVGIFFDPPYGVNDRGTDLYHHDSTAIAAEVLEWVRERGQRETYRIVLAGYEEYQPLLSDGWMSEEWLARGGYSALASQANENRKREMLYFSPYCYLPDRERKLF